MMDAYRKDAPKGRLYDWSLGHFLGHDAAIEASKFPHGHEYKTLSFPESRRQMHRRAIEMSMNPNAVAKKGEDKHFVLVIGPPGARKSSYGVPYAKEHITPELTDINVDNTRPYLLEYKGHNSNPSHNEAAYLTFGGILNRAFRQNHHILYDATGNNQSRMEIELKRARQRGYKTHMIMVNMPSYKALGGTWERFQDNAHGAINPDKPVSRFVDPVYARSVGTNPKTTFDNLKHNKSLVDHATLLDSDVNRGEKPAVLEGGYERKS